MYFPSYVLEYQILNGYNYLNNVFVNVDNHIYVLRSPVEIAQELVRLLIARGQLVREVICQFPLLGTISRNV